MAMIFLAAVALVSGAAALYNFLTSDDVSPEDKIKKYNEMIGQIEPLEVEVRGKKEKLVAAKNKFESARTKFITGGCIIPGEKNFAEDEFQKVFEAVAHSIRWADTALKDLKTLREDLKNDIAELQAEIDAKKED